MPYTLILQFDVVGKYQWNRKHEHFPESTRQIRCLVKGGGACPSVLTHAAGFLVASTLLEVWLTTGKLERAVPLPLTLAV